MGGFENNLAYEASAGSGKTFMLVVRYLSLLFQGADPAKILALTFTNKAAYEMQERIVVTLEELEKRNELYEIMKVTNLSKEDILLARQKILEQFLNSHTKIMTIDSFFTQILRKFSLYVSLMPDFSTASSQHQIKLILRFLKEVDVARKTQILIDLSLDSRKRLNDIFSLLDQFYEKKQEFSHIKFFPQKTYPFEQEALEALNKLKEIVLGCEKASATVKKAVNAENFEELLSKTWIERESLDYRTFSKCFVPEMDTHLQTIKNAIKNYYQAREQNFFYALNELVLLYEKAKKALYQDDGELSFSDVTVLVYHLLKERIDSEFLYFRLDTHIEHILLDEFQDTSILQYEILKPLIDEILSGEGIFEDGSFFFVGDIKQSIYRFRGGVSALFENVAKECGTKVEPLLMSYRSKENIVAFVNDCFREKIKNYEDQLSQEDAKGGYVAVLQNDEVLEGVVDEVKNLLSLGYEVGDIAILCATNKDGDVIKEVLENEGIEVVTETTTKLIAQRSIEAILEYLKYLYFEEDIYRYNFFSLIQQEIKEIPKIDLNTRSLVDVIRNVVNEYRLFENDFHILRFLDVVQKYPDIESLLFEYERLDTPAASTDLQGVRVLTIHKSKGLEFENVIVMDRLTKEPPKRDTIIYEYDGIQLQNLYFRMSGRDKVDTSYRYALEKEKKLVYEDTLNALYVAFTRAKENLFIIQKVKDSSFRSLELTPFTLGTLVKKEKDTQHKKSTYTPLKYQPLSYGIQDDILVQDEEEEEGDFYAQHFGLALHYMLEMMGEFSLEYIDDAKDMMLNKYGYFLQKEEVEDIINRVKMLILNPTFLTLIQGDIYKEKGIKYKQNLYYLDLLVKDKKEYRVIDYKSSLLHQTTHQKQVKNYKVALQNITKKSVQGYICYVLKEKIEFIKVP